MRPQAEAVKQRFGIVAALALSAGLFAAAPASAASLNVTPNSDLPDSAMLSVSGTGWNNGAFDMGGFVNIQQCTAALTTCTAFGSGSGSTNSAGTFATTFGVSRAFTPDPPGPPVDCGGSGCVVRVEDFGEGSQTVSQPITFASGLPKPTPTATTPTVTPPVIAPKKCRKPRKLRRGRCVKKKKK